MKKLSSIFSLFLFFLLPFAGSAQIGLNKHLLFVADMSGDQEVPPVGTNARGLATFLISEDLSSVAINAVFSGLSGPITGCHVHIAPIGANGPVLVPLTDNIIGNTLRTTIPLPAGFLAAALEHRLYLNVHTAANPNGEIRGQLNLRTEKMYGGVLTGLNEVPPVITNGNGVGFFAFSPGGNKMRYQIRVAGLSGPITGAHIHDGAPGVVGPVVVGLNYSANTVAGEIDLGPLPFGFFSKLDSGLLYVNVHTAANPGGEIRSQLISMGPLAFEAYLNGDQETPPVATIGFGVAIAKLSSTLDTFTYYVGYTNLSGPPTGAHFHVAPAGMAGPIEFGLQPSALLNLYADTMVVTPDFVNSLLKSNIYANIHTAANPGGEIRGQMEPMLHVVYAFDACGGQEVPPNNSPGKSAAAVSHDRLNTMLDYAFVVDGLTGPATAAHFHVGSFGEIGPVKWTLETPAPYSDGVIAINGNDALLLASGDVYLNVHTTMFSNGEIRGQVQRGFSCTISTSTGEPLFEKQSVSPNPFTETTEIRMTSLKDFDGRLEMLDAEGALVYQEHLRIAAGEQVVPIHAESLSPGVYFVRVSSVETGASTVFKMIKL